MPRKTAAEMAQETEYVTPDELAERLGFARITILRYTNAGRIPYAFKLGTQFRYDMAEVLKHLKRNGHPEE